MFHRSDRRLIARLCLGTLLFMQLAVAAYACPGLLGMAPEQHMSLSAQTMEQGAMSDCADQDQDNLNLCRQHYQAGDQFNQVGELNVVPLAIVAPLTTVEPAPPLAAFGVIILPVVLQRTTAPPPHVRFGVFRI